MGFALIIFSILLLFLNQIKILKNLCVRVKYRNVSRLPQKMLNDFQGFRITIMIRIIVRIFFFFEFLMRMKIVVMIKRIKFYFKILSINTNFMSESLNDTKHILYTCIHIGPSIIHIHRHIKYVLHFIEIFVFRRIVVCLIVWTNQKEKRTCHMNDIIFFLSFSIFLFLYTCMCACVYMLVITNSFFALV